MESVESILVSAEEVSPRGHAWPDAKRVFDVVLSLAGVIVLSPVIALIAAAVWLGDRGPIFYRQTRVGMGGREFEILKFRTMVPRADRMGPSVTKSADHRVTRVGRWLRKTKLDEVPQLWNVLVGDMSLVGPRPEVPRFVDRYTPEQRRLLDFRPGITDLATLLFRNEESLLAGAADVEAFYVEHCIPRKFELNMRYAKQATLWRDCLILLGTVCPYWLAVTFGYLFVLGLSLVGAYLLRFDFHIPGEELSGLATGALILLPIQILCLLARREMTGLLSYFGPREVRQLAASLSLSAILAGGMWLLLGGRYGPPRSVILIDALVAFCALCAARSWLRDLRERRLYASTESQEPQAAARVLRVGIIGAGELGAWLTSELNHRRVHGRRVEVVFDDDPQKWHKHLHGIPVAGMPECILDGTWAEKLDEVIVAIPGASPERLGQVRELLHRAKIPAKTVPGLSEILSDGSFHACLTV